MPTLSVPKDAILGSLGGRLGEKELEQRIFDFGIELDDVYEEDGRTMYKFDIPANRYDLLCTEGLARALRPYLFGERYADIEVSGPTVCVYKFPTDERHFIACAVIRGMDMGGGTYDSFISYQDKLHLSIGRNRSIVAIGTHDFDKMSGPIVYRSTDLGEISLSPLNSSARMRGDRLKEHYRHDKKISKYFGLLKDEGRSVVFQSGGVVISVPPIINSYDTKISRQTKNIFIDVTGTDFNKVNTALKLILYNFRGASAEAVLIKEVAGGTGDLEGLEILSETATPVFHNRTYEIPVATVQEKLNLELSGSEIKALLEKMMYNVELRDGLAVVGCIDVRSDIMHACDIIEDVAVGYGFNNFAKKMAHFHTMGAENTMNRFTDKIRGELAVMGFNEVLTLTLLSRSENFVDAERQVVLSNPKSREYEVVRTSLLPGVLKSVAANLHVKIPIKVFEASDVVFCDESRPEGARNARRLCGCLASNSSMLEELQGPLSLLFEKCGLRDYRYEHCTDPRYLENQSASVVVGGEAVGSLGVLHPRVCVDFGIPYAASAFEIDLEALFRKFAARDK